MRIAAALVACLSLAACAPGQAGSSTQDDDTAGSALTTKPLVPSQLSQDIVALYSQAEDWQHVADLAYGLVGYDTPPCATFMSYALRELGSVTIPNTTYKNYGVRINTSGLSGYLEHKLGWQHISSTADLMPGDSVFTRPADVGSDHPAHTYMFNGWIDDRYAWVIDNEADEYCSPDEPGFVGFCEDVADAAFCCRGKGMRQWKRSITEDIDHLDPDGTPDTDQRMWFALRGPA